MSAKLDKSLDEILSSSRQQRRRQRRGGPAKAAAPAGGVKKQQKAVKPAKVAAPAPAPIPITGDSKIIVSGLPSDVDESSIKASCQQLTSPPETLFCVKPIVVKFLKTVAPNSDERLGSWLHCIPRDTGDSHSMPTDLVRDC
ncbi:hypothetical protein KEM54_000078 [Ascosphaera aggregata]|nr:hypothetical protein KEM54_000078 [Ascosphaera aggregata]